MTAFRNPLSTFASRPALAAALGLLLLRAGPSLGHGSLRVLLDVPGTIARGRMGQSVAAVGDFDGDGRPDFAIGCPGWGPAVGDSTGEVLVYFGRRDAMTAPDLVLAGFQRGSQFGFAIAGVGDVNGDGFDDLIVTAPGYNLGDPSRYGSGRVYLYLGGLPADGVPDRILDPVAVGFGSPPRFFGSSAVGLGDIDGDGYADWAIGFDNSSTLIRGGVMSYLGGPVLPTNFAGYCGAANGTGRPVLAAAGDFDGDGRPDLAIGQPLTGNSGPIVALFTSMGANGSTLPTGWTNSTVVGFGAALVSPGDLNGDGLSDVLIGVPVAGGGSQVRLWPGSRTRISPALTTPLVLDGAASDSFGCALAAGKPDGSGAIDLLVGACGEDSAGPGAGAAYHYRLSSASSIQFLEKVSGSAGDYLGRSVAIPGDVDGNGSADLLVGAPFRSASAPSAGRAVLMTSSSHTLLAPLGGEEWPAGGTAHVRWRGTAPADLALSLDDGATWSPLAAGAGGAAEDDFAVGVPDTVSGRCRIRISPSGLPLNALHTDRSEADFSIVRPAAAWPAAMTATARRAVAPEGGLGAAVDAGADFDGDGTPDQAIGAPLSDFRAPNAGRVWITDGAHEWRLDGEQGGEGFGASVALRGDYDHDGWPDLLVGAPGATGPAVSRSSAADRCRRLPRCGSEGRGRPRRSAAPCAGSAT